MTLNHSSTWVLVTCVSMLPCSCFGFLVERLGGHVHLRPEDTPPKPISQDGTQIPIFCTLRVFEQRFILSPYTPFPTLNAHGFRQDRFLPRSWPPYPTPEKACESDTGGGGCRHRGTARELRKRGARASARSRRCDLE